MKTYTFQIPGATYTADSVIHTFTPDRPVLAITTMVDMGAITTSTNVDLVWKAYTPDSAASKSYHDISLTDATDAIDFCPSTGEISAGTGAPYSLTVGGPLALTIDATWGGGSVVITNIWVTLIMAD